METINGYELTAPLSADRSGFGRWGFARKDGLEVFIKEFLSPVYPLHPEMFFDSELEHRIAACDRFVRSKQMIYSKLNQCDNGNIIVVLDFFRYGAKYYIVTEKVDDSSLTPNEIYALNDPAKTVLIAKVICNNLHELHRHGIIHADLKPGNILLKKTASGFFTAKIIDFDSSFLEGQPFPHEELEGDPVYLAPEMFRAMQGQRVELTSKIDVFAIGVLLYQFFFGTLPMFRGAEDAYAFESVLVNRELLFPDKADKHLKKLLTSMLQENPKKRPDLKKVLAVLDKVQKK